MATHADPLPLGIVENIRQLGPVAEIIGDHDDIKAVAVHGVTHNFFEPRGMGRDTQKTEFALLLESIEGFVDVRVHEALDGIAGVNMGQVKIVGADPLEDWLQPQPSPL